MSRSSLVVFASLALVAIGCNKPENKSNPSASTTTAAASPGEEIFKQRCVACHGETGHGDGPGAAALNPKPRNYTDVAWQGKVTDEDIKKTIVGGGAAVGKSPAMPPNPDLEGKPELDDLVKKIRSFKGT